MSAEDSLLDRIGSTCNGWSFLYVKIKDEGNTEFDRKSGKENLGGSTNIWL
jgi:hypothetical protein